MLDSKRILTKVDQLDRYLAELRIVAPVTFGEYQNIEKRRSCERLLQIAIEATIDICHLFVAGYRLGVPSDENDLFDKLAKERIISEETKESLRRMKGFRNIIVHEYADIDDEIVYDMATKHLDDFSSFRKYIINALD